MIALSGGVGQETGHGCAVAQVLLHLEILFVGKVLAVAAPSVAAPPERPAVAAETTIRQNGWAQGPVVVPGRLFPEVEREKTAQSEQEDVLHSVEVQSQAERLARAEG